MDNRTKNAKRNIFWGIFRQVISMILGFLLRSAIIYWLGEIYAGLSSLFTSILEVLSLTELGVGEAMVFSMYKPLAENDYVLVRQLMNLYKKIYRIIGCIIAAAGLLIVPILPYLIKGDVPPDVNLYILYFVYLFNTAISYFLFGYKESILIASQRSDIRSNISTLTTTLMQLLQIVLLALFRNYYVYCVVVPLMSIIRNIIIEIVTKKKYPDVFCEGKVPPEVKDTIKKNVEGIFIYKVGSVLANSFDSIAISAFLGLVILGKYQYYYHVISSVVGIFSIIATSITAGVGNSIVKESQDKNYKDFNKFQHIYMWGAAWATTCFFCMYQTFMKLWVGESMLFDDSIIPVFCLYFFAGMTGKIMYVFRQATGIWYKDRYRPIIEGIINLTLNIILVKILGVAGVMLSTIFCYIFIGTAWGSYMLFKEYFTEKRMSGYLIRLVGYAVITLIGCLLAGFVCRFISAEGIPGLILRALVCFIVPNIFYFFAFKLYPEHNDAMKFVIGMIKRKL